MEKKYIRPVVAVVPVMSASFVCISALRLGGGGNLDDSRAPGRRVNRI